MALEDELYAEGLLNDSSYRMHDITDFITRAGACLQSGTETKRVLKTGLDEKAIDGQLILPAGFDLKEAAKMYLAKCREHWGRGKPTSDLAAQAFGLDGITPTLKAQAEYLKNECGGSVELFAAKAKEFSHPGIGRLAQGQLLLHDKGQKLPPATRALRDNPWLANDIREPKTAARIRSIILGLGTKKAAELAAAAGKTVSGFPLIKK